MRYIQLGNAHSEMEENSINMFAIVVDAGYPFKGQNKFICSMKVIDSTCCSY